MSGPLVPVIGGPYDGQEGHLVTYKQEQEVLYEAGDWSKEGPRLVHVYRSPGGRSPFVYQGTREWVPDVDVVRANVQHTIDRHGRS